MARLLAETFAAPTAVILLLDGDTPFIRATIGLDPAISPSDLAALAGVAREEALLVVGDLSADPRTSESPLVRGQGCRFYAGMTLRGTDDAMIGAICVLDREARPHGISRQQRDLVEVLARHVSMERALRFREVCDSALRIGRRSAEAALRSSQDRYRALFEAMDTGFCVIELIFDADGSPRDYRFLEVNPAFVAQSGMSDVVGRMMREIVPDHEQHWFDAYGQVALTGEPIRFEQRAAGIDGRWFDVHAFRIGAAEEHQVAVLFTDISERRQSERALRDLNTSLDARVTEAVKAREAAQDALRQSQKLEAIGQLTGGVAHDFNNLLTVIRGSVDLLRREDLPPARRARYIDAIGETADRAARVTGQLLAFARRQALTPSRFDVGESVRDVAEMLTTLTGARIAIDVRVPDDAFSILADRAQFDTAIVNIGINARDAMNGEGRLSITVEATDAIPPLRAHDAVPGGFVAISLTDTGSGIAPDDLGRVFEPFFTTKGVGEGTGLGLSQVIGFAKQSGGDVQVESTLGEGTRFTLYLPRAGRAEATAADVEEAGPADVAGHGACVLVVEDNPQVGEFATHALRELGYQSVMAPDAAHAMDELARDGARFDIVFSDVMMPGMNGLELGAEIRRRHPGLPVILTSGYSSVLAREGQRGFELLRKPYSVDQLSRVLRKAMSGHPTRS